MRAHALGMSRWLFGAGGRPLPLWVVATCGVLAGALTAHELGGTALAAPPADPAPAAPTAMPTGTIPAGQPSAPVPAAPVSATPAPAPAAPAPASVAAAPALAPGAASATAPISPAAPAAAAAPLAPAAPANAAAPATSAVPTLAPPAPPVAAAPGATPTPAGRPITFLDSPEQAAPQAAAPPPSGGFGGIERIVIILAVMVGGVFALAHFRKKHAAKPRPKGPELRLVGHVRVAGRWQVALVRVPGRTLVLGSTEKGLSLLATLTDEATPAADEDDPYNLADLAAHEPAAESVEGLLSQLVRPAANTVARSARSAPVAAPAQPSFEQLLSQLTRTSASAQTATAPSSAPRERTVSPADALRARLERYQQDARRAG